MIAFMGDETCLAGRSLGSISRGNGGAIWKARSRVYACETRIEGTPWPHNVPRCAAETRSSGRLLTRKPTRLGSPLRPSACEVVATQPRLRREVNTSRHPTFTSVASRSVVTKLPLVAIAAHDAEGRHRAGHQRAFQDLRSWLMAPAARNTIGRSRQCSTVSLSWRI